MRIYGFTDLTTRRSGRLGGLWRAISLYVESGTVSLSIISETPKRETPSG
nr:hypothetical protein JVH1_3883 [Rhodococcus sp. JVH1]